MIYFRRTNSFLPIYNEHFTIIAHGNIAHRDIDQRIVANGIVAHEYNCSQEIVSRKCNHCFKHNYQGKTLYLRSFGDHLRKLSISNNLAITILSTNDERVEL